MACPSPFQVIPTLQQGEVTAWRPWCDWGQYLISPNASKDVDIYLSSSCTWNADHSKVKTCPVWDTYCHKPETLFATLPLLVSCSIYSNAIGGTRKNPTPAFDSVTLDIGDLINATGFLEIWEKSIIDETLSLVTTGMISWCALIPGCAQTQECSSNLISKATESSISTFGILGCLSAICDNFGPHVNKDFGGYGVCDP